MLFARAGTPQEIVDRLHSEMTRIMATPELQTRMSSLGLIPYRAAVDRRNAQATSRRKARSGAGW